MERGSVRSRSRETRGYVRSLYPRLLYCLEVEKLCLRRSLTLSMARPITCFVTYMRPNFNFVGILTTNASTLRLDIKVYLMMWVFP